jgi:MFS superfamily sulfate permease-like transporter
MKSRYKLKILDFFPDILILMIIVIVLSASLDLQQYNVAIIGNFNNSLMAPRIPNLIEWDFIGRHLGKIITISVVGFFESQTVTRTLYAQFT